MIGLDFIVTSLTSKLDLTSSPAARSNESHIRLREGEKKQFCRREKTDKQNQVTYIQWQGDPPTDQYT